MRRWRSLHRKRPEHKRRQIRVICRVWKAQLHILQSRVKRCSDRPGLTSLKGSSGAGLHSGPLCPSSFRSSKPAGSGFSFGGANDFDSRCTGDRSGSRSCSNKELLNTTRCRLLHHRPIPVAQRNFAALPTGIARTTVPGRHCMETMVCTCSAGCGPWTTQHVVSHLEPR
jgi:hypothetical protein